MKGFMISLEGTDGAGKTEQTDLLEQALREAGLSLVRVREPGGTPIGETIRGIVQDPNNDNLAAWTEACLFMAARAQLIEDVIFPALESGKIVLADRFSDSTIAYQGIGRGLDVHLLEALQTELGVTPDLTFVLDVPAREGLSRQAQMDGYQQDRMEMTGVDFLERVRQGFLHKAARSGDRCVVIDGTLPIAEIGRQIREKALAVAKAFRLLPAELGGL